MFQSKEPPPEFTGIPGRMARFAHGFRRATQIFPPPGVGVGVGLGVGCGFGWPLRQAYGPPRALCGPSIGFGIGVGYGQGFGRRFGKDTRPDALTGRLAKLERWFDSSITRIISPIRQRFKKNDPISLILPCSDGNQALRMNGFTSFVTDGVKLEYKSIKRDLQQEQVTLC